MRQIFIVEYKFRQGINGPRDYQSITLLADGAIAAVADAYCRLPSMDLETVRAYPRGCARRDPIFKKARA